MCLGSIIHVAGMGMPVGMRSELFQPGLLLSSRSCSRFSRFSRFSIFLASLFSLVIPQFTALSSLASRFYFSLLFSLLSSSPLPFPSLLPLPLINLPSVLAMRATPRGIAGRGCWQVGREVGTGYFVSSHSRGLLKS